VDGSAKAVPVPTGSTITAAMQAMGLSLATAGTLQQMYFIGNATSTYNGSGYYLGGNSTAGQWHCYEWDVQGCTVPGGFDFPTGSSPSQQYKEDAVCVDGDLDPAYHVGRNYNQNGLIVDGCDSLNPPWMITKVMIHTANTPCWCNGNAEMEYDFQYLPAGTAVPSWSTMYYLPPASSGTAPKKWPNLQVLTPQPTPKTSSWFSYNVAPNVPVGAFCIWIDRTNRYTLSGVDATSGMPFINQIEAFGYPCATAVSF
jgi:hypothetical protein